MGSCYESLTPLVYRFIEKNVVRYMDLGRKRKEWSRLIGERI